jgi:hypothetical protein
LARLPEIRLANFLEIAEPHIALLASYPAHASVTAGAALLRGNSRSGMVCRFVADR